MNIKNHYNYTFNIAWQVEPINNYVYVYCYKSNHFLNLSDISKEVWMYIGQNRSIEEIVAIISEEYLADADTVQGDVMELITDLLAEEAIECSEEGVSNHNA